MRLPIAFAAACLAAAPAVHAATEVFTTTLSGAGEVPPNGSTATGSVIVTLDLAASTMRVQATFAGLSAPATASHIHCCILPGSNTGVAVPFPTFPNATSGTFDETYDMTALATYNGAFVSANGGTAASAYAAFRTGLESGMAYYNIHDVNFPGGEIEGFLAPVPEPAAYLTMALGLAVLGWRRRRG